MTRGCYHSSPEADTWYSTNVLTQATQQDLFLFRVCCTYSNDYTRTEYCSMGNSPNIGKSPTAQYMYMYIVHWASPELDITTANDRHTKFDAPFFEGVHLHFGELLLLLFPVSHPLKQ